MELSEKWSNAYYSACKEGGCFYAPSIPHALTEIELFDSTTDHNSDNDLFVHEFGHTYQSRITGLAYLFKYGIPSAAGGGLSETDANRRGYLNLRTDPYDQEKGYSEKPNRIKWWEIGLSSVLWPYMWIWNR
jgi:hypothetical protein